MPITRISIDNPVFATMLMLALVVFGMFSYRQLPIDQFPNIDFPVVVVNTEYPGASPEAVESEISRPVENAVNSIAGIKILSSRSYEGRSVVIIQFELTVQSDIAVQDVREKVGAIQSSFRTEIKQPQITRFDPDSQPIVSIGISSDVRDLRSLTTIADQVILKRLQNVRGVGQATIVGGVKRQINIHLRPDRLESLAISVEDVTKAVREENQDIPAGTVSRGSADKVVEVRGRVSSPAAFKDLIIARRGGAPVRLGEIADIEDGQEERETVALFNGNPALAIDIVKVQGANTIEVADGVAEAMKDLAGPGVLPTDVVLKVVRDSAIGIRNSVTDVRSTLIEGALLTIAIVFLFLNSWRSTVITGLTLPVSVIGTFAVLRLFGFTLNMMTLMALSLVIGILIDDAIVVRENITRHLGMGKPHRQAAMDGTTEIGLAVTATTLTIVAVFMPVAFMGGIVGRFFLQFGITISAAVLISLFVSFTLDPMLSSVWYDPAAHGKHGRDPITRLISAFDRGFDAFARFYDRVLGWSLRHRRITLLLAFGIFIGSFGVVKWVGVEFAPAPDLSEVVIQLETPVGSSLDYTRAKLRLAEETLRHFPEVSYTYATINVAPVAGKNQATLYARLISHKLRKLNPTQLAKPFREALSAIPGVIVSIGVPSVGGTQKQIQLSIQGRELPELDRLSQQVMARMRTIPGMVDIDSNLKAAKPTLAVRLERDIASDLGIGTRQVAASLRPLFAGDDTTTWKDSAGETYDVQIRLPESERRGQDDISRIYLSSGARSADGSPRMVPLTQLASIATELGASQISRRDLSREVQVTANAQDRPVGDLSRDLQAAMADIQLPPGYRFVFGGSTKDIQETSGYAGQALLLAVILIYLILASQFGSFLQPFAIMASLPLSLIGVLLGLLVAGSTLNIFSVIGFITLMGLVTKNAILLVDFTNHARARGLELMDALREAGQVRLRPIVMTTMAMVFGMMPLALGLGEGGNQRAPMAHAVIGGLISSTVLTLVVVPVLLIYLDRLSRWSKRFFASARAPTEEQ